MLVAPQKKQCYTRRDFQQFRKPNKKKSLVATTKNADISKKNRNFVD